MLARLRGSLAASFGKVLAVVVGVLLFSYFFSMGLGLFLFYFLPEGIEVASRQVAVLPLSLFMVVNFEIPLGVSTGLFFLILWLVYLGAFSLAWSDRPRFPFSLRNLLLGRLDIIHSNYLAIMPQLASLVLAAIIFLQSLQESAGVQTGGLRPEPPVVLFLAVSYAPLAEEFSYRITTMGFLSGLLFFSRMRRHSLGRGRPGAGRVLLLTMWKPEAAKELLGFNTIQNSGIRRGISLFEWVLLVITSVAFGAVHYLAGGGWEIGKISTAALSGFAMGLVYLRYGAYAPILLHWFFNYYFGAFDLASQLNLVGFRWASDGVQFLNVGFGTLLAVVLIVFSLRRMWRLKGRRGYILRESAAKFPNVS